MIACYDLQRRLPTYDFFYWLVHVKMLGATRINISLGRKFFMRKKWPRAETERRLAHYILPGISLSGLPGGMGEDGDREVGTHLILDIWRDAQRLGRDIPRLDVNPTGGQEITVTLRNSGHKPDKNSNVVTWRAFAERVGAKVVKDHDQAPLSLRERMAIYAGARMNLGVPNGPLSILTLTTLPVTIFSDPAITAADWARQGIAVGAQVPWAAPHQRIVWREPTLWNLLAEAEKAAA